MSFDLHVVHPSWLTILHQGLAKMDNQYLHQLSSSTNWLPGATHLFSAFSVPFNQVQYVLLGESPYPRRESANGYAFWDAAVHELWSPTGLSTRVNRATSFRNLLKMLLLAEGLLQYPLIRQQDIAQIDKQHLVQTNAELFQQMLKRGFLLLNATLALQPQQTPKHDVRAWEVFIHHLLTCLLQKKPNISLILFGKLAHHTINAMYYENINKVNTLYAEHPYNLSFVTNSQVLALFQPLHLLRVRA